MGKASDKVTKIVIFGTGRQARMLYNGLELSDEPFEILGVYGERAGGDTAFGFPVHGPDEITGLAGADFDILFDCMETDAPLRNMLEKAFGTQRVKSWDEVGGFLSAEQTERWMEGLRALAEEDAGYALPLADLMGKKGDGEEEYLYLLLAAALCQDRERDAALRRREAADTDVLDRRQLQELLEGTVRRFIAAGEYERAFAFLGDLLFQKNKFLFSKILDRWTRYYYILLEIAICEKKRGAAHTVLERWADWREFETPLREFKFAFRRIWFGFATEEQRLLLCLAKRYQVSADFLAVLCKGAVHEDYAAAVLRKSAELFQDAGQEQTAAGLFHYAALLDRMHPGGKPCMSCENCCHDLEVTVIDAKEERAECQTGGANLSGEHEIACILCVNDDDYADEVILYLKRQKLPEGYRLHLYFVRGAKSMTAGYELARKSVSAEIKLYIHQDTFIFDEEYVKNLIEKLQNEEFAMLGLAGTKKLPDSAVWGESAPEDMMFCLYQDFTLQALLAVTESFAEESDTETWESSGGTLMDTGCCEAECIDGVLMAAREDVPWREDLFQGFHFYDISACMEYRKRGYRVGIFENGGRAGVLHEVNVSKNEIYERSYEEARRRFLREYREK